MKKIFLKSLSFVLMFILIISLSNFVFAAKTGGIVIKLAHVEPETRSVHQACVEFEKYVEGQTEGKVDVQIYPNGQLGGDRQAVEGVGLGTIQMTVAAAAVMSTYDSKFMVLDLPFLFKTREASYRAVDGELGKKLNSLLLPIGLVGLGYNDNGLRQVTNNIRLIEEPKDLKGIKIRVMENPVYIDLFKLLGANPTPMNFGEVYTALQQGTVDAQENGASLVYASKFYEVQKYMSLTNHVYSFNIIVANDKFFSNLPTDIQKIVVEGARKCLVTKQREFEAEQNSLYIEKLKEAGMKINDITPENRTKFMEAVEPLYEKYQDKIGIEFIDLALKSNQ